MSKMMFKLKILGTAWKCMKTADKVKFVLDLMTSIGLGIAGAKVADKLVEGENLLARICIGVGVAGGLAGGGTIAATNAIDEEVDWIAGKIEEHRAMKKQKAEVECHE